jgi:hypothetical protein
VTSSINAVTYNGKPLNSDVVVDETWFSSPDFCKQSQVKVYVFLSVVLIILDPFV